MKNLLVVEDDDAQRIAITELIGNGDVTPTAVAPAPRRWPLVHAKQFDCVVVDLDLPDMNGFELIERIKAESGQREITEHRLHRQGPHPRRRSTAAAQAGRDVIVKDAKSPERLLDETALFLHRVEATLPESKRKMLRDVHRTDPMLEGKQRAHRRRRHAQHLRADQRARALSRW